MGLYRLGASALVISIGTAFMSAETVRAPLVGTVLGGQVGFSWYTETRIWNPNSVPANVVITDVIGDGNPLRRTFTIPPGGVLDLPVHALFFDANPPLDFYPPSWPWWSLVATLQYGLQRNCRGASSTRLLFRPSDLPRRRITGEPHTYQSRVHSLTLSRSTYHQAKPSVSSGSHPTRQRTG